MSKTVTHLYWDTCVFVAFLNNDITAYSKQTIDDIGQYLREAVSGECKIYTSTLTIAEMPSSRLKQPCAFGSFRDFLNDYRTAIMQVVPDPNVMEMAADLHGQTYTKTGGKRKLETPDAIHLATAVALTRSYGVNLDAFHTFDNGGQRGVNGKATPLLTYEQWCEVCQNDPLVIDVINLNRIRPNHPAPGLPI